MPRRHAKGSLGRLARRAALGAAMVGGAAVLGPRAHAQLANPPSEPPRPMFKADTLRVGVFRLARPEERLSYDKSYNREVYVSFPMRKTSTHVQAGLQLSTPTDKLRLAGPYAIVSQFFNLGKLEANVSGRARVNMPILGFSVGGKKFSTQFGGIVSYERAKVWADAFGDAVRVYRYGAGYRVFPTSELFAEYTTQRGLRLGVSAEKFLEIFGTSFSAQALTHARDPKGATLTLSASSAGVSALAKLESVPQTKNYMVAIGLSINPASVLGGKR